MNGKRTPLGKSTCAIARSLDIVGDWWSLLIVRDAFRGRRRFGELQVSLGLAKNILAARLKKLVDEGVLEQVPAADGSKFKEYALTKKGEQLQPVMVALWQWGEAHCFAGGELTKKMVDRRDGSLLLPLEVRNKKGVRLGPRDLELRPRRSSQAPSH